MAIVGVHEEWLSIKFSRLRRSDGEPARTIITTDLVNQLKNYLEKSVTGQDIIVDIIQK